MTDPPGPTPTERAFLDRWLDSAGGEREAACAAYGRVLDRWGEASPGSVTADDARARRAALGFTPP